MLLLCFYAGVRVPSDSRVISAEKTIFQFLSVKYPQETVFLYEVFQHSLWC